MFGFGENRDNYEQVYNSDRPPHEAKFSHEAIAGAASFAAFKMFEDHQRREGSYPLLVAASNGVSSRVSVTLVLC
jgi:hypothetical protein